MKKAIVTTTINPPTKALMEFLKIAKADDWKLIIVGDQKTPHKKYLDIAAVEDCVLYLEPKDQEDISKDLSELIGWNCIQRRNFGLILAYQLGAEVIATIDDDNIPYLGWGKNVKAGQEYSPMIYKTDCAVFDPLALPFPALWHRGFPIQLLDERNVKRGKLEKRKIMVQADFWNGNPDVDAICRISLNPEVTFNPNLQPFGSDKIMPFNSQNTFLSRECFPTYFLFPHIGRMDDIFAAYVLQHKYPNSVMFAKASVYQDRNEHDLVKDLKAELIGYESAELVATEPEAYLSVIPSESLEAYEVYKTLFK